MKRLISSLGTTLIAFAFMGFGILHFVFQAFVTGRGPAWPPSLPGEHQVAYVGGVLFFTSGITIFIRKGWLFPFAAGLLVLLWPGLRNIYELIARLDYGVVLTSTNKALVIGGCALAMASMMDSKSQLLSKALILERYFLGIFLFTAGIQHFIFVDFVKFLIPAWIPSPIFWAYFAGIALIAAGLGLITGIKAQLASMLSGCMVFVWLLVLHLPRAFEYKNANEWTAVAEATLVSGILLVVASRKKDN